MRFDPFRLLLPFQLVAACGVVAMLAVAPPAEGRMLLLPVLPGSGHHLAAEVLARGGRLVGSGPVRGSLVVDGARDQIAPGLRGRGVLILGAALVGCGAFPEGSR